MLTVRVIRQHNGNSVDSTHEIVNAEHKDGTVILTYDKDGSKQVFAEGEFFVMNGSGKTVATYRLKSK